MKKTWLRKAVGISLLVLAAFFFVSIQKAIAADPYITFNFSDIDYDKAQYIRIIIDADKDLEIELFFKDNDNKSFSIIFETTDDYNTGEIEYEDKNELFIYLDEDEFDTKESFDNDDIDASFAGGNSFTELVEWWNVLNDDHELVYDDGSKAELEKIRFTGDDFKIYYLAILDDSGDEEWECDIEEGDIEDSGDHSDYDLTKSSNASITYDKDDYIRVREASSSSSTTNTNNPYYYYPYSGGYSGGYQYNPYQQQYNPYQQQQYNPYQQQQTYFPQQQGFPGQGFPAGLPFGMDPMMMMMNPLAGGLGLGLPGMDPFGLGLLGGMF